MKKIKKLLILLSCFAMVLVSSVTFTACSTEQVEENTKTVIETSSSIIPVELNKSAAQSIFTRALEKLILTEKFSYTGILSGAEMPIMSIYGVAALNEKGQRFAYSHLSEASGQGVKYATVQGYYDDVYCELNPATKEYYSSVEYDKMIIAGGSVDQALGYMLPGVTDGRYYEGYYYISAQLQYDNTVAFVEVLIKDNTIEEIHFVENNENAYCQSIQIKFNYVNIDTSKVVMSLDGYTNASNN